MAKAKGTLVVSAVKVLRANPDRARELLSPSLHKYLAERVIVTQWYPEEEYYALVKAVAEMIPPMPDVWDFIGRNQAQVDLGGVHRAMVKPGDAMGTLKAMRAVWPMYHDSGRVELRPAHEGAFVDMYDYALVSRELCAIYTGYMRGMVELSMGKDTDVRHAQCRARGDAFCSWRVRFFTPKSP